MQITSYVNKRFCYNVHLGFSGKICEKKCALYMGKYVALNGMI